jgi:hypothetical protein
VKVVAIADGQDDEPAAADFLERVVVVIRRILSDGGGRDARDRYVDPTKDYLGCQDT